MVSTERLDRISALAGLASSAEIRAMAAELLELRSQGWRDIATAPRDGTTFQAWLQTASGNGCWHSDCRFNPTTGAFEIYGRIDYDIDDWDVWSYGASHWMLAPAPPSQERADG